MEQNKTIFKILILAISVLFLVGCMSNEAKLLEKWEVVEGEYGRKILL